MFNCQIPNYDACCCVCALQVKLVKHPWNETELLQGRIVDQFAYGCAAFLSEGEIVAFDNQHGMCECFESKEK